MALHVGQVNVCGPTAGLDAMMKSKILCTCRVQPCHCSGRIYGWRWEVI